MSSCLVDSFYPGWYRDLYDWVTDYRGYRRNQWSDTVSIVLSCVCPDAWRLQRAGASNGMVSDEFALDFFAEAWEAALTIQHIFRARRMFMVHRRYCLSLLTSSNPVRVYALAEYMRCLDHYYATWGDFFFHDREFVTHVAARRPYMWAIELRPMTEAEALRESRRLIAASPPPFPPSGQDSVFS